MISVETKTESKTSLPISSNKNTDEKPSLSFSELLKGFDTKEGKNTLKINTKIIIDPKNQTKIDTKNETPKKETLASLLKGDKINVDNLDIENITKGEASLEINPKITENISTKEVKLLISDAKDYLKEQIVNSDGYKESKIKELPKTLKGLTKVAQEFNIDVSKISVEDIQPKDSKQTEKNNFTLNTKISKEIPDDTKNTNVVNDSKIQIPKSTPIFKPTVSIEPKEHTTQQLVQTKQLKTDVKPQENTILKDILNLDKTNRDLTNLTPEINTQTKQIKKEDKKEPQKNNIDGLKQLLQGDKTTNVTNTESKLFAETEKTITTIKPLESSTQNTPKSLEQLLQGDKQTETTAQNNFKTDSISVPKADSLDVKLHEAKQMIRYISQDVKNAIEDYKSPFTRIKVQLNPQKLGEIDLTVVQRGKNLHVNLSSNNVAINTLAQNMNELKVQLNNSGINNATLNFNNSSQNPDSNQNQGQREQQREARREYNYFEDEEKNEEILNSLEIIVPRYI